MQSNGRGKGMPVDKEAYEDWFLQKVQEALADTRPTHPHIRVMGEVQMLIDRKRRAVSE